MKSTTGRFAPDRWRVAAAAWLLLLPLLSGCGGAIVGDWYLVEANPNRQVFGIDNASFRSDGTFSAAMTIEGLTTEERGTYDFNGFKLKLRPKAGGQRTYLANVQPGRLEIANGQRKVVLKKGKRGG